MTALLLAAAALVWVVGTARATRLVVHDDYPPVAWARLRWLTWTAQTPRREPWGLLATCPFCAAPYIAGLGLAAGIWADVWQPDLSTLAGWWWVLAVWATGSYLAAMLVVRDEPPAEEE